MNRFSQNFSHDVATIERMGTRAVWLEKGRILAEGDPAEAAKYLAGVNQYTG